MTLTEFQENKAIVAAYQSAIQSEAVQLGLAVLLRTYCRPVLPDADKLNKSTSEFCLGENSGSWKMLDAISNLGTIAVGSDGQPTETYGAGPEPEKKPDEENAKG